MQRNFVILLLFWILSLVGISLFGGWVVYGFFYLLTLLPLFSLLYILCVTVLFKIFQSIGERHPVCNRACDYFFILQNESPLLFSGVRVIFYSSFSSVYGLDDKTEYELKPRNGIRKKTQLLCRYRGEYEVGIKQIVIEDYLRLFRLTYKNREPFRVSVKPDIVQIKSLRSEDIVLNASGALKAGFAGVDTEVREYIPGDDTRAINWKATAVSGRLMVRKTMEEKQQGIGILMDSKRYDNDPAKYLPLENKILEAVIALALHLSSGGIPTDVCCLENSLVISHIERNSGFNEFYERMCSFCFRPENTQELFFGKLLSENSIFGKRAVFLVTAALEEAALKTVQRLGSAGIAVIIYLIGDKTGAKDLRLPLTTILRLSENADLSGGM